MLQEELAADREGVIARLASDEYWKMREAEQVGELAEKADALPRGRGSLEQHLRVACTAYANGIKKVALEQLEKALQTMEQDIADASHPRTTDNLAFTITQTYNDVKKRADINKIIELVSKGLEVNWESYGIEILPLND